jgi:glycosyltransferase involved in cell wall biosynthesis
LRHEYAGHADFLGRVSDTELVELYAHARALVMPNVEEFGIAGVEAQAAGRPVLAASGGGASETVIEGVTGHLLPPDDVTALAEAMADADLDALDPDRISANARRFSVAAFRDRIRAEVDRIVSAAPAGGG